MSTAAAIQRVGRWLGNVASLITALFFVLICAQVVARYFLHTSITWSEEAARYAFAWATLLGAAAVTVTAEHYAVRIVDTLLGPRSSRLLAMLRLLLELAFFAVVAFYGFRWVHRLWGAGTPVMQLNQGMVYAVVPVTALFMVVALLLARTASNRPGETQ